MQEKKIIRHVKKQECDQYTVTKAVSGNSLYVGEGRADVKFSKDLKAAIINIFK